MRDRYDLDAAAAAVRVPVLWFETTAAKEAPGVTEEPATYKKIAAHKMFVWVNPQGDAYKQTEDALNRWLDKLQAR